MNFEDWLMAYIVVPTALFLYATAQIAQVMSELLVPLAMLCFVWYLLVLDPTWKRET